MLYQTANKEFPMPDTGVICISGGNGALGLVMGGWLLDKAAEQGKSGFEIKFLSRSMKISVPFPCFFRLFACFLS